MNTSYNLNNYCRFSHLYVHCYQCNYSQCLTISSKISMKGYTIFLEFSIICWRRTKNNTKFFYDWKMTIKSKYEQALEETKIDFFIIWSIYWNTLERILIYKWRFFNRWIWKMLWSKWFFVDLFNSYSYSKRFRKWNEQ